jgi:hypothetical protein
MQRVVGVSFRDAAIGRRGKLDDAGERGIEVPDDRNGLPGSPGRDDGRGSGLRHGRDGVDGRRQAIALGKDRVRHRRFELGRVDERGDQRVVWRPDGERRAAPLQEPVFRAWIDARAVRSVDEHRRRGFNACTRSLDRLGRREG